MSLTNDRLSESGSLLTTASEWERCKGWIEAAIRRGCVDIGIDQVRGEVEFGRASLWPGKQSAAVCGLQMPLGRREYHIWLAGGNLQELRVMETWACEYAKSIGCDQVIIHGRKGWVRALAGYEQSPTIRKLI